MEKLQSRRNPHPAGPDRHETGLGNAFWSLLVMLAAPLIGSGASALVWIASVGGVFRLLPRPTEMAFPRPVLWCALAFASFFLAEALSGLLHWRGSVTIGEISENLVFFGLLPLFVLFERNREILLDDLRRAAPWFALLAFAIALFQQSFGVRPEGGAGNSGVFAIVCSILFVFCCIRLAGQESDPPPRERLFGLAGFVASAASVLMSGSRALWPVVVAVPVIIAATGRTVSRRLAVGVTAALVVIAVVAAFGPPGQRVRDGLQDLRLMQEGNYSTSFGKRMIVWQIGVEAIRESPWLGQGPDAPRRLMRERSVEVSGILLGYNHFHNVILNEWVRAGIPGLLAIGAMFLVPLVATWRNRRRDAAALAAFQLVASAQFAFLASGMFNILFDHDIVDAMFVAVHALALYLSFGETGRAPAPRTSAA
jgi:O-antigen ligase